MRESLLECIQLDSFRKMGLIISQNEPDIEVQVNVNNVIIRVDPKITLSTGTSKSTLAPHESVVGVHYGHIRATAEAIVRRIMAEPNRHALTYLLNVDEMGSITPAGSGTEVYKLADRFSDVDLDRESNVQFQLLFAVRREVTPP